MEWKAVISWIETTLPFFGMVLAVTAIAIHTIVSKVAMANGASFLILSVYSNALAALILFPCGFLFHRSKRPPLTFALICKIFLLASFGCLADIGSYAGIEKSSPTLATELLNLIPGFTYILAVIFRMEGLNLRRSSDIFKLLGTVVSIAGASIVTIYKGPAIMNKASTLTSFEVVAPPQQDWIVGGTLLAVAALSAAAWTILQNAILKIYSAEMIVLAFYTLFVTIQSTIVTLIAEKDATAWKLQADMGLVSVLYAGLINITLRLYIMLWCLWKTGSPLFVSIFYPLTIVISVAITVIFFREVLYLGSVVGAIVLVSGFYAVIWGRAQESKVSSVESTCDDVPLLQDRIEDA